MIHSLAGGVIKDNGVYTFVKVRFSQSPFDDRPFWYVCPFPEVEEGTGVFAPVGRENKILQGTVVKVERNLNEQLAPVPMNKIKEIDRLA